jgi:predicted DNA-binding transcriptional regulator AlpA
MNDSERLERCEAMLEQILLNIKPQNKDTFLTTKQAAKLINKSVSRVYTLSQKGTLKRYPQGFKEKELLQWK